MLVNVSVIVTLIENCHSKALNFGPLVNDKYLWCHMQSYQF